MHRGVLLLAFAAAIACAPPAQAKSSASAPKPAPSFSLPTRDGGTVSSDSLRGKVVYVDFWASWCTPCRRSFPWLQSLHERYGGKGLVIVAINLDKHREDADAFLAKYPAPFTVAFDPAGKTADAFKVSVMPSSFVIDSTGAILLAHAGFDPRKTAGVETLIQEACTR